MCARSCVGIIALLTENVRKLGNCSGNPAYKFAGGVEVGFILYHRGHIGGVHKLNKVPICRWAMNGSMKCCVDKSQSNTDLSAVSMGHEDVSLKNSV